MRVTPVEPLSEVLIVQPDVYGDDRGEFLELYRERIYRGAGIGSFVQDNLSRSRRGVLRGLHFQNPGAQGKLVTVVSGAVFDVAVDIRRGSPTFGQWVGVCLDDSDRRQLWVPPDFAHGFQVLSEVADVLYKCTAGYRPDAEHTLRWNDADLGIEWRIDERILSEKDRAGCTLRELEARDALPWLPGA